MTLAFAISSYTQKFAPENLSEENATVDYRVSESFNSNELSAVELYNRGNNLILSDRYSQAIKSYQQAATLDPNNFAIRKRLGIGIVF